MQRSTPETKIVKVLIMIQNFIENGFDREILPHESQNTAQMM